MQTPQKATGFLEEARAKAADLHRSIEEGLAKGEVQMQASLKQSEAKARELASTLKTKAQTADAGIKAKLAAAAQHAEAVAKDAENRRPRPMLADAQKLSHSISEAIAHVRSHGSFAVKS